MDLATTAVTSVEPALDDYTYPRFMCWDKPRGSGSGGGGGGGKQTSGLYLTTYRQLRWLDHINDPRGCILPIDEESSKKSAQTKRSTVFTPSGLDLTANGILIISDMQQRRLFATDPSLRPLHLRDLTPQLADVPKHPEGVRVDNSRHCVYFADDYANAILSCTLPLHYCYRPPTATGTDS